jgi:hypothetical protein
LTSLFLEFRVRVRVRVTLRLAVYRQSVRLGTEPLETNGQNFFPQLNTCAHSPYTSITSSLTRGWACHLQLLLVLASAFILGSESRGTRDHNLLPQIRDFRFCLLLRLAGLRWRYSTLPPHGNYSLNSKSKLELKSKLCYDRRSVGHSVLVSSSHVGLKTRFLLLSDSYRFVDVGGSLELEGGSAVYNCCWASPAHSFLGPSPAVLVTIFYRLRFETPRTWRAKSPYLYPPGTGWPSYTPRHWVKSKSKLYYDRRSVGQSVFE